tara:strand:+ start:584 stop:967 length:384 start_codon:yes stop_codon:yes gene_type:complete
MADGDGHGMKYFLKFSYANTYAVPLHEGSIIHKYMHCSGKYCLLFRSVRETIFVDVLPATAKSWGSNDPRADVPHLELRAEHDNSLVLVADYPVGQVVKVREFAEQVKLQMIRDEVGITEQQKVKPG